MSLSMPVLLSPDFRGAALLAKGSSLLSGTLGVLRPVQHHEGIGCINAGPYTVIVSAPEYYEDEHKECYLMRVIAD